MRKVASGSALTLSMLVFPLGLVVLLVSEQGYRVWGVPIMLAGVGLAFSCAPAPPGEGNPSTTPHSFA